MVWGWIPVLVKDLTKIVCNNTLLQKKAGEHCDVSTNIPQTFQIMKLKVLFYSFFG